MVFLPHWPIPNVRNGIQLGLERVHNLLQQLGNPEKKLPPVVHVAGTNGKGSTIAYLKEIFEDAGYKVHRYTSPHLVNFNERIVIAGKEITDSELYALMEEVRAKCENIEGTFFEITTAAILYAFSKVEADILFMETGMGGRLDATNVVDNPLCSIITPISFDHMEFLGNSLTQIAFEKAGIIKPNCPVVVSWQMKEAMDVIRGHAKKLEAPIYACDYEWEFNVNEDEFKLIDVHSEVEIIYPKPSMFGIHQVLNASTAAAACNVLGNRFNISYENVVNGLKNAKWPGRFEQITQGSIAQILPEGFELWIDGAHNTGGAQMLAETIKAYWKDKPLYVINGRTGERDIRGFLDYFKGLTDTIYAVKVVSEPKGEYAENIKQAAESLGFRSYACDSLKDAISLILKIATAPSRILICGSLYLYADLQKENKI